MDTAVESKYTPIAACRIVDTRISGGAIRANSSRSFHALGSGSFTSQGGTSGGIFSATAVTGSVIAVGATGPGFLRVFGYGAALAHRVVLELRALPDAVGVGDHSRQ